MPNSATAFVAINLAGTYTVDISSSGGADCAGETGMSEEPYEVGSGNVFADAGVWLMKILPRRSRRIAE